MPDTTLGKLYQDHECIVHQGEVGNCIYVIQKGEVEVISTEEDHHIQLRILHEGDVFGEMAIFERESRSATVRSIGQSQVLTIDRKTFLRRVKEDPTLAFNILKVMSTRLRNLNKDIVKLKRQTREPVLQPVKNTR